MKGVKRVEGRASFVCYESTRGHPSQYPPTFTIGAPLSRSSCLRSRYRGNGQIDAFHIHAGHSQKGRATVLKLHVPPSLASSSCVTTPQKTGPAIKLPEVRTAQRTTSSKCSEAGAPKSVEAGKLPPDVTMREAQLQRTTETMHGACVVAARCDTCQRQTEDCVSRTARDPHVVLCRDQADHLPTSH